MLISQLPDIVQKSFCTSDGAMDLTFHMNYVPAVYHVCSWRNEAKTVAQVKGGFFCSTLYLYDKLLHYIFIRKVKVFISHYRYHIFMSSMRIIGFWELEGKGPSNMPAAMSVFSYYQLFINKQHNIVSEFP